jgi:hypothetical protein
MGSNFPKLLARWKFWNPALPYNQALYFLSGGEENQVKGSKKKPSNIIP